MKRRPVKRSRRRRNLRPLAILTAIAAVAAVVWLLSKTLFLPMAVIVEDVIENRYTVDAVIIRDETVIEAEGNAAGLKFYAEEGAIVERGTQIAQVYAPGYSQNDLTRLKDIQDDVKKHYMTLLMDGVGDTQLRNIDRNINDHTAQLRAAIQSLQAPQAPRAGSLLPIKRQLERSLTDRHKYLSQKYANDTTLDSYLTSEKSQKKRIENWTVSYIADRQAIVTFYPDGYEKTLTPDSVTTLSAGDIRNVLNRVAPEVSAAERARVLIYKLVSRNSFYVAAICKDPYWLPQENAACRLTIEGLDDVSFDAVVVQSSRIGGELIVRLYVEHDVRPVLDIRQARATISPPAVGGLRVPISALYTNEGRVGIVLPGNIFVPVKILSRDTRHAIIEPTEPGSLGAGQKVLTF